MKAALFLLSLLLVPAAAPALDVDDVIELSKAGVSADVILHRIDASDDVFRLSNEDIIRLKDAGVNDRVIMRMIDTERDSRRGRPMDEAGEADDEYDEDDARDEDRYDRDVDWDVHLGLGYYRGYGPRWYDYSWFPYSGLLYDYYWPPYYHHAYSRYPHYRWGTPGRYRHTYTKRYEDRGRASWSRGGTRVKGHSAGTAYRRGTSGRRGAPAAPPGGTYRNVQRKSAPPAYAPPPSGTRSGTPAGSAPPSGGSGRSVVRKK
jgi:hypothetical protein